MDEMIFEDTCIKVTLKNEQDNSYYVIRTLEMEFLEVSYFLRIMKTPEFALNHFLPVSLVPSFTALRHNMTNWQNIVDPLQGCH
jgi:hypothetical protein